jgi:hypothetical protein
VREFLHRRDVVLQRVTSSQPGGIFGEWSHLRTRHHRYFSVEPGEGLLSASAASQRCET